MSKLVVSAEAEKQIKTLILEIFKHGPALWKEYGPFVEKFNKWKYASSFFELEFHIVKVTSYLQREYPSSNLPILVVTYLPAGNSYTSSYSFTNNYVHYNSSPEDKLVFLLYNLIKCLEMVEGNPKLELKRKYQLLAEEIDELRKGL